LVQGIIDGRRKCGSSVGGVLSPAIEKQGQRIGSSALDLLTGQEVPFARLSRLRRFMGGEVVGDYTISREGISFACRDRFVMAFLPRNVLCSQPRVDCPYLAVVSLKQIISGHEITRFGTMEIEDKLKLRPQSNCFQLSHRSCLTAGNSKKGGATSAVYLI